MISLGACKFSSDSALGSMAKGLKANKLLERSVFGFYEIM